MTVAMTAAVSTAMAAALGGCAGAQQSDDAPNAAFVMWGGERDLSRSVQIWESGELEHSGGMAHAQVGLLARSLLDAGTQVVFLGETHVDDVTHRVEFELYRQLLEQNDGKVILTLEQFEWDAQPALDAYLAGEISETQFLARSRPWGNYREAYRPLIELAKKAGAKVIAGNFPAPLRRKIRGSAEGWAKLTEAERKWVPDEIHLHSETYWARVDRAIAGHSMGGGGPKDPESRRYSTQALWDNAMAAAIARALDAHPGHVVLHIAGKFHVEYHDGTVAQLKLRKPDLKVATATILPRRDLWGPANPSDFKRADVVIYAKSTARDNNEGRYGVAIDAELRYRAHVPRHASYDAPLPLLIWLGSTGSLEDEELRYWRTALGDAAVILAVEPLHRSRQPDLRLGGRWFWDDGASHDLARVHAGLERITDYALRRFPIDAKRVVVAGRGSGATAALWAAKYTGDMKATFVVAQPSGTSHLAMGGTPGSKPATQLLWGVTRESGADALRKVLDGWSDLGVDTNLTSVPNNRGEVLWELEAVLRKAMGLPDMARASEGPVVTLLWTALYARRLIAAGYRVDRLVTDDDPEWEGPVGGEDAVLSVRKLAIGLNTEAAAEGEVVMRHAWAVSDLAKRGALPSPPGPFGGTTVLLVPADASEEVRAAYTELQKNDPLAKTSRFRRLHVVFEDQEGGLAAALEALKAKRRRNVLVVPASFYAGGEYMRALESSLGDAAEGMTLHWLPGLGARLAAMPVAAPK
jgi:uncharacterized iron-regulated protein